MQPAEARLHALQPIQHRQGLGRAAQMAQAGGRDQQQIPVLRPVEQQGLRRRQRFRMAVVLLQSPQAGDLLLDRGGRRGVSFYLHVNREEERPSPTAPSPTPVSKCQSSTSR